MIPNSKKFQEHLIFKNAEFLKQSLIISQLFITPFLVALYGSYQNSRALYEFPIVTLLLVFAGLFSAWIILVSPYLYEIYIGDDFMLIKQHRIAGERIDTSLFRNIRGLYLEEDKHYMFKKNPLELAIRFQKELKIPLFLVLSRHGRDEFINLCETINNKLLDGSIDHSKLKFDDRPSVFNPPMATDELRKQIEKRL